MDSIIIKTINHRFTYYLRQHPTIKDAYEWSGLRDKALVFEGDEVLDAVRRVKIEFKNENITYKPV